MLDGVFALDPDWEFTYLNERGRAIVCEAVGESYTAAELVGRNIWELLPEARGTTFEDRYREAMRTDEEVAFDEYYAPIDVWFDIRASPSETGLTVCFRDITKQRRRRERLESRESSFEERIDALLGIGQRVFGTPYGSLSCARGEEYVFEVVWSPDDELRAGDAVDLSATNCERVVLDTETLVLANVATDAPDLTDRDGFAEWGISCYIGTPVVVDSDVYGTFCFYDTDPREEPFSEWEVALVDLMGRWVSVALDRQLVEDRLRRLGTGPDGQGHPLRRGRPRPAWRSDPRPAVVREPVSECGRAWLDHSPLERSREERGTRVRERPDGVRRCGRARPRERSARGRRRHRAIGARFEFVART
jgi:GAF domain-containing protein